MVKKTIEIAITSDELIVSLDPNKDGEALLKLVLSLKEAPDELLSLLGVK